MTSGARLSAACSMLLQQSQKLESLSWAGANNSAQPKTAVSYWAVTMAFHGHVPPPATPVLRQIQCRREH